MKHRWLLALAIQILEMGALCALQCWTLLLSGALYTVLLWGAVPLAGLLSACRAVRRGLLNYAAWIAPPACLLAAHGLIIGIYSSGIAGAALLTAFLSLVGAAAGEVLNQRKAPRKHRKRS